MLRILKNDKEVFYSEGKWLHPLFEVETYLEDHPELPKEELLLRDSVIGRAAALLIARMGFRNCHGELMSKRAIPVFEQEGISYEYTTLVEKLACRTEEILKDEFSPDEAHRKLRERIEENKNIAELIEATKILRNGVNDLCFDNEVTTTYNPLNYAWEPHKKFIETYGRGKKKIIFLGMNPGPWGMAQTGIPFGEIEAARDWLKMTSPVKKPSQEHPKRPIQGFDCPKSEVSGRRLWSLMKERYGTPEAFFENHYVLNYCPLVFMGETGKNITPDKLPKAKAAELYDICDTHLKEVIRILDPEWVIGVGKFALQQLDRVAPERNREWIIHPSPANPHANRGWAPAVEKKMSEIGLW